MVVSSSPARDSSGRGQLGSDSPLGGSAAYIPATGKKLRWRITRIRGNRADRLGVVEAPDSQAAIKAAIVKFDVDERDRHRIAIASGGPPRIRCALTNSPATT
jgi:hypothetical protein